MKIRLLGLSVVASIICGIIAAPNAQASLSGCPTTWGSTIQDASLDISHTGDLPTSLYALQKQLGFNLAIKSLGSTQISLDGQSWVAIQNNLFDRNNYQQSSALALDSGAYGKISYSIQEANCGDPSKIDFVFPIAKSNVQVQDAGYWLNQDANRKSISAYSNLGQINFSDLQALISGLPQCQAAMLSRAATQQTYQTPRTLVMPAKTHLTDWSQPVLGLVGNPLPDSVVNDPCGPLLKFGLKVLFEDLNCLPTVADSSILQVALNKNCKIGIGVPINGGYISFAQINLLGPKGTLVEDQLFGDAKNFVQLAQNLFDTYGKYSNVNSDISFPYGTLTSTFSQIQSILGTVKTPSDFDGQSFQKLSDELDMGNLYLGITRSRLQSDLSTVVCLKGKAKLKITGYKPKCPSGYK